MFPAAPVMATRTGLLMAVMGGDDIHPPTGARCAPLRRENTVSDSHSWAPPAGGQPVRWEDGRVHVPDRPIVCFIEGDGTGPDIWRATKRVLDAAVAKTFGGAKAILWYEILAGEKARDLTG